MIVNLPKRLDHASRFTSAKLEPAAAALRMLSLAALEHLLEDGPPPKISWRVAQALKPWLTPSRWRLHHRLYVIHKIKARLKRSKPDASTFNDTDVLLTELGRKWWLLGNIAGWWRLTSGGPIGLEPLQPLLADYTWRNPQFCQNATRYCREHLRKRVLFLPDTPPIVTISPEVWEAILGLTIRPPRFYWRIDPFAYSLLHRSATHLVSTELTPWEGWLIAEAMQRAKPATLKIIGPKLKDLPVLMHPKYAALNDILCVLETSNADENTIEDSKTEEETPAIKELPHLLQNLLDEKL